MTDTELYASVGGKLVTHAPDGATLDDPVWYFGWIPEAWRDDEQHAAHEAAERAMNTAAVFGRANEDAKRTYLTKLWSHPRVVQALGFPYTGTHQLTGSCFVPGTKVLLADGNEKRIETFVGGEQVVDREGRPRRVVRPTSRKYTGAMITVRPTTRGEAREITSTACHRFLTADGDWGAIGDVAGGSGRVVYQGRGTPVSVRDRTDVEDRAVHCLEVEGDPSFVANGFTVHNCVGAGMGNATATLNFVETILLGQPEKIFLPFYPYAYGRGRLHSGMRGRGEGSTGSGQAKAVREDGVMDNAVPGAPRPVRTDDGIVWGESVEMAYSAGDRSPCTDLLEEGRRHPITDVAKLKNHDEVRQALQNGKPVTCASMYAFKARVEGEGADACLLGRRQGSWSHQMTILDYWEHPKFGPLFWLMNQWGLRAHGTCPSGMPMGGAWITGADVDWICRDEVYAFAGHSGWVTPTIDWFI